MSFRLHLETISHDQSVSNDTAAEAKSSRYAAGDDSRQDSSAVGRETDVTTYPSEFKGRASTAETLDHIIELTVELKQLASLAGFNRLGLILMLAEQEARQQLGKNPG